MEGRTYHMPVLLREVIEALIPTDKSDKDRDAWILDATLGDGGHTIEFLRAGYKVLGIDQDPQALQRVQKRISELGIKTDRLQISKRNFADLSGLGNFKRILFDLGVSSLQLLEAARGFSIKRIGPLDMRMDPSLEISAKELINGLNKGELDELFTKLGQEKLARPIADYLVRARQVKPVETTKELADLVERVYKKYKVKSGKIHPATKVFQALRIAVNDELNSLKDGLSEALIHLEPGGRIVVLSFHSLEDRIVKETFMSWEAQDSGNILTKKPIVPGEDEVSENPYSRSAKMRVFEKK